MQNTSQGIIYGDSAKLLFTFLVIGKVLEMVFRVITKKTVVCYIMKQYNAKLYKLYS